MTQADGVLNVVSPHKRAIAVLSAGRLHGMTALPHYSVKAANT